MNHFSILIVEDDPLLAEMHAEFIKKNGINQQIWIAGNLSQAITMIDRLKPDLILLDNYLPDGKGIELVLQLNSNKYTGGIIFITAASDMTTITEAVRYGVFDYLIKPIAYDRLVQSIERFLRFNKVLNDPSHATQRKIDNLFNTFSRHHDKSALPIGIDELTLEKIKELFMTDEGIYTAETIAKKMKLSRTTARRYLEFGVSEGFLAAEVNYGKVGRPQRLYSKRAR